MCPGKPNPEWLEVLHRHPERLVLGTDTLGGFEEFERSIRQFDPLFEALQPATRDLVARGNAERLWFAG